MEKGDDDGGGCGVSWPVAAFEVGCSVGWTAFEVSCSVGWTAFEVGCSVGWGWPVDGASASVVARANKNGHQRIHGKRNKRVIVMYLFFFALKIGILFIKRSMLGNTHICAARSSSNVESSSPPIFFCHHRS